MNWRIIGVITRGEESRKSVLLRMKRRSFPRKAVFQRLEPFCQIRWTDDDRVMGRVTRSNGVKLEGGGGRSKSDRKDREKRKRRIKRKNCDRLVKSNYAINCHANAPLFESITRSIHARFDTLLRSPEYLISLTLNPLTKRYGRLRHWSSPKSAFRRVGGVAISCTTCAVRGKQRSARNRRCRQQGGKPIPRSRKRAPLPRKYRNISTEYFF